MEEGLGCEGWGGGRVSHARDVEGEAFGEEGLLVDGPEFLGQERVLEPPEGVSSVTRWS